MISANFDWQYKSSEISSEAKEFAKELSINDSIVEMLIQRGYDSIGKIRDFLNPSLDQLRDPFCYTI